MPVKSSNAAVTVLDDNYPDSFVYCESWIQFLVILLIAQERGHISRLSLCVFLHCRKEALRRPFCGSKASGHLQLAFTVRSVDCICTRFSAFVGIRDFFESVFLVVCWILADRWPYVISPSYVGRRSMDSHVPYGSSSSERYNS